MAGTILRWGQIAGSVALALVFLAAAPARAEVTYTYVGTHFGYIGTGSDVTNVSGTFTVATPLPANATTELKPASAGGAVTRYRFTDGRTVWDQSNYVADTANKFSVTTDASGKIVNWYLNIESGLGWITTCTKPCIDGRDFDNISVSNNYNAFVFNAPGTWSHSQVGGLDGSAYDEIAPTFTGSDGSVSFIRLGNVGATPTTYGITVVGSPSGTIYGKAAFTISPNASPQYPLSQILTAAGAGPLAGGDTSYSLYLQNTDPGASYQHIIFNSTSGFFENASVCKYVAGADYTPFNSRLANVHTSRIQGYPTQITIHNYAQAATAYDATVIDAATGVAIGVVPINVGGNASITMPFSSFEQQLQWAPAANQLHANITFTAHGSAVYAAKVAQYVVNQQIGTTVNMTQRCGATGSNYGLLLSLTATGGASGTVSASPSGLSCGPVCSTTQGGGFGSFAAGTTVVLTAVPASDSIFQGWSGACTGKGTCAVAMNVNQSVSATFAKAPPATYALSIGLAGTGAGSVASTPSGISCGSTCSASFASGAAVTLTATATGGSTFQGWGGACSGTGACTVTMSYNQSVTASFSAPAQATAETYCGTYSGHTSGGDAVSGHFTVQKFSDGVISGSGSGSGGPNQPISGSVVGTTFTASIPDGTKINGSFQNGAISGTFVDTDPDKGSSGTFTGTRCY